LQSTWTVTRTGRRASSCRECVMSGTVRTVKLDPSLTDSEVSGLQIDYGSLEVTDDLNRPEGCPRRTSNEEHSKERTRSLVRRLRAPGSWWVHVGLVQLTRSALARLRDGPAKTRRPKAERRTRHGAYVPPSRMRPELRDRSGCEKGRGRGYRHRTCGDGNPGRQRLCVVCCGSQ